MILSTILTALLSLANPANTAIPAAPASTAAPVNPVIPMTAITGKPDRKDVTEMLCDYRKVGIEQFLIYPRSGLEIEYMSEEWFNLCRDCIEVADSLDMKVWLYDEYNWPSGNCKGQVTADGHEDCYPKMIWFDRQPDGSYNTSVKLQRQHADNLDPKAVSRFIELTHERYYREFGEYFGNVVKAIFTDEPIGYCTVPFDREHFGITWYDGLERDYRKATGGRDFHKDVVDYLNGKPSGALWEGYYTVYGERMRHTFIEPINDWCEAHKVKMTGHIMYEKLYKGVRCNGNSLKMLSAFGLPGFDEACVDIDIRAKEMEISGLALVQYASRGKSDAMCELYSVGPADLTLSHQRQLMWMCAAFGVNNYVVAVAAMDARGNKEKGDWYFQSGRTQPWFDYYREFCPEAATAASFARKEFSPKVLIRVPSSYFMSLDKTPAFENEGKQYLRFLEALMGWQFQFQLLDEGERATPGLPVLGFGPGGFFVEGESRTFRAPDSFMTHVAGLSPRDVIVLDESGNETRDVLVRHFDDGSTILVDLTDNDASDRMLSVLTTEGKGSVRLPGHGVFAGTFGEMGACKPSERIAAELQHPEIRLQGANLVRCLHTRADPEFRFTVRKKLKDISFLLRSEVDPTEVLLDGKPLVAENEVSSLPQGFRSLYKASDKIVLKRGEHKLSFSSEDIDMRYLPTAFIEGVFSYDRESATLDVWKGDGSATKLCAPDYVGSYDIVGTVKFPTAAAKLCLDTNLACTELLVDGQSLGRKAWGPYEWEIPSEMLAGSHEITVRISNSIMPMFGNVPALDEDQPYLDWVRIRPGQHGDKSTTGVFGIWFRQ